MKRAFLLLVLLCLLPIHALAQFITVPDEIYEALLADEVISSYASTKEELLPLITLDYHIKCNTAPKKERHCVRFVLE